MHAKDDADGMRWGFTLDLVELGVDEDNDPITTLVVSEQVNAPAKPSKSPTLSSNEQIALTCLEKAIKADGRLANVSEDQPERTVVTEADWRKWYYSEAKPGENQETKRQAFKRSLDALLAKGRIACRGDFIWRAETWCSPSIPRPFRLPPSTLHP